MELPKAHQARPRESSRPLKWKAITGLVLLLIATALGWYWIYALLFLAWAVHDGLAGSTHFIEPVRRDENPVLFWVIVASWVTLSLLWGWELLS
ncbi:MAG: hypothetical protein AAF533_13615 [Acidobacteriota bacterium]